MMYFGLYDVLGFYEVLWTYMTYIGLYYIIWTFMMNFGLCDVLLAFNELDPYDVL